MHEKDKTKNRAAIALTLCFCVLVLTSFLAVKSTLDKINNSGVEVAQEQATDTDNAEAAAKTPVVDSEDDAGTQTQDETVSPEGSHRQADYIAPLEGSIQLEYSMDSLVYSKTLDQYMTHSGVDITADMSTEVKAVADGIVTKVYSDDRYGMTVCIAHNNGVVSIYSNLAEQGLAETGDEVTQGQTIGCVGDTALFESLESTHLHFEMAKDENCVDPGEYIDALKKADS